MADLNTGVVISFDVKKRFGLLSCETMEGVKIFFHLNHRRATGIQNDTVKLMVPFYAEDLLDKTPQQGDFICFIAGEGQHGPRAVSWVFLEEYAKADYLLQPPIYRVLEQVDDNHSIELWKGSNLEEAAGKVYLRKWYAAVPAESRRTVQLGKLQLTGWWERFQYDGSWETVKDPIFGNTIPLNHRQATPVLVH